MMIKDTVFGADASAANQFAPYLSLISSLAGGKPAQPAQGSSAQKTPDVSTQLASMQKTQTYMLYGVLGVGVFGMLYLLLKK